MVGHSAPTRQDGELVPDESEPELIPPKHILIENIVREPRVKVFGTPKLGAYLAVPMTYDTWLQPGGEKPLECVLRGVRRVRHVRQGEKNTFCRVVAVILRSLSRVAEFFVVVCLPLFTRRVLHWRKIVVAVGAGALLKRFGA